MKINFNMGEITHITVETSQYIDIYIVRTTKGYSISFSDDNCPESIFDYVTNTPYTKFEKHDLYNRYEWEVK